MFLCVENNYTLRVKKFNKKTNEKIYNQNRDGRNFDHHHNIL